MVLFAIDGSGGVTWREFKDADVTESRVEPLTPLMLATTVAPPAPAPVARPVFEIVATAVFEDVQLTEEVRFCTVPSL